MKRFICLFLSIFLIFPFHGCKNNTVESPVTFYYLRKDFTFGEKDGIISSEIVDGTEFTHLSKMLSAYLQGPSSQDLASPFPAGTYLLSTERVDNLLILTLSDNFASLTGISLSIACCAIAKTVSEYTDIEAVEIQTVFALLDGEKSVTVNCGDIVLYDSYDAAEIEPTQ